MLLYLLSSLIIVILNTWINRKFFVYKGLKGAIYYIPPVAIFDLIYVFIRFTIIFLILLILS